MFFLAEDEPVFAVTANQGWNNMNAEQKPGTKVLIAEDDPVSRRMLQLFLTKWGYTVVGATDGLEAARLLERDDAPQLAILDWMMPGLEGPQVCQRIRENSRRSYVYILLLTARTQKADLLQGLEAGADDYLTKPFDAPELRARLHVGERILALQQSLVSTQEELLYRATHDALTSIANRGVVLDALTREHSRQQREHSSFGIILMDLDHFKYVNDTYGHLAGDAVLREMARRMSASIRPYDTLGRYGGEEFLVIAPSSDDLGTMALAERIRNVVASSPVATPAGEVGMTVSCGIAVSNPESGSEPSELLHLADEALYRAKHYGRNRCQFARLDVTKSSSGSPETVERSMD
jgi:two-component system, cell cycle response regulator